MGFLGFGKKKTLDFTTGEAGGIPPRIIKKEYPMSGDFVDLRDEEKEIKSFNQKQTYNQASSVSKSPFDFLTSNTSSSNSSSYPSTNNISSNISNPIAEVSEMSELRVKLRNMTTRIEDQSNEIYRLVQRIELLERKLERFEGR
ncbi:MAG: hypothetical protein AABW91_02075 [Nanoarchaeota archaeon]